MAHQAPISHCLFEFPLFGEEKLASVGNPALSRSHSSSLSLSLSDLGHMVVVRFLEIQAMFAFVVYLRGMPPPPPCSMCVDINWNNAATDVAVTRLAGA